MKEKRGERERPKPRWERERARERCAVKCTIVLRKGRWRCACTIRQVNDTSVSVLSGFYHGSSSGTRNTCLKFTWHCDKVQLSNHSRQASLIVEAFLKQATRSFGCRCVGCLYKPWIMFFPVSFFSLPFWCDTADTLLFPYREKRQEANSVRSLYKETFH